MSAIGKFIPKSGAECRLTLRSPEFNEPTLPIYLVHTKSHLANHVSSFFGRSIKLGGEVNVGLFCRVIEGSTLGP